LVAGLRLLLRVRHEYCWGKIIDAVARRATGQLSRATCVFIRTIESQIIMLRRAILWARYLDEDKKGQQNNLYPVTHHVLFLSDGRFVIALGYVSLPVLGCPRTAT